MPINPSVLINIILAILALYLYYQGSYRFYHNKSYFLQFFGSAIALDIFTAVLGSFKITPTTIIPGSDFVPWGSILFNLHVLLATFGFFGFIILFIYVSIKGKDLQYPRIRPFQFKILLPAWILGESIALINSLTKLVSGIRLYDYF
jgi:hypothetical protein